MLRSLTAGAMALAVCGCRAELPRDEPQSVATAMFDPTKSQVPLPNDLVFFNPVNSVCPPPANEATGAPACAQAELLAGFGGAFPSDQDLAITIDFTQTVYEDGVAKQIAPDLDFASFGPANFYVSAAGKLAEIPIEPPSAAGYAKFDDHGTLSVHHAGRTPWPTGSYAVVLRGGPNGAKTTDNVAISPSQVFDLIIQGLDMTDPKNLGLLKAQLGSTAAAIEQGKQLNLLIGLYKAAVFPVADGKFPHHDLAIASSFKIGATVTNVEIDPGRGKAPLPFDLLRDPKTGKLSQLAACTLAGGAPLDADGKCPSPAAAGFLSLDGFSTTGAILGPTSDLVKVSTVTPASLMLFDLSDKANPIKVPATDLILEPCEFSSGCGTVNPLAPVIAIQPGGATAGGSVPFSRPLKDGTDYAVVMTTGILDKAGNPIGAGTVAKVLKFKNSVSVGGRSTLQGIDDATANSLEIMRLQLKPVLAALADDGIDSSKIALAYTFRTQSFLKQAVQLAALPYLQDPATALPVGMLSTETVSDAFTKFGATGLAPSGNIEEILETDITTFDLLDPATGAFHADPALATQEKIHVLIATPFAASAPLCIFSQTLHCAPMVIFRHGLGSGRIAMLLVADAFAKLGMVTVAIDAAKHGDRSFCTSGTTGPASGCVGGADCVSPLPPGAQGDANPPGKCATAGFIKKGLNGVTVGSGAGAPTDGIPPGVPPVAISGNYLITQNFFRTRDSMRQDLIDESQLIRALVVTPPSTPMATGNSVFDHMASVHGANGVIIDPVPGSIYYVGQSLGSLQGAMDVAANPRIAKAVFNAGGGTIVDIFANSPTFKPLFDQLLGSLGIDRATDPAKFLQFLTVAKTVLDPADPINYVGHLTSIKTTLPNLLPPLGGNPNGTVPQLPKTVLTQTANCDAVVPNPFGLVYSFNAGVSPLPPGAFAPGAKGTFQLFAGAAFSAADFGNPAKCTQTTAVSHAFLVDTPALSGIAQSDAAAFLKSDITPPSVRQ